MRFSLTIRFAFCVLQYSPELKMLDDRIALQHFAAKVIVNTAGAAADCAEYPLFLRFISFECYSRNDTIRTFNLLQGQFEGRHFQFKPC